MSLRRLNRVTGGDGGELNSQALLHLQLAPGFQIPFVPSLRGCPNSPMHLTPVLANGRTKNSGLLEFLLDRSGFVQVVELNTWFSDSTCRLPMQNRNKRCEHDQPRRPESGDQRQLRRVTFFREAIRPARIVDVDHLSAGRHGDHPAQPGVGSRHHLHPHDQGFLVPGGLHGLV